MDKTKNISYNITFALNCLLVFLILFGKALSIPTWLQVVGRMHPLLLHFPIVLLVVAIVWEGFLSKNRGNTEGVSNNEIGDWILLSAALTAAISAVMGLFLSQEEGYNAEAIAWHKWTGVAVSLVSFTWFSLRNRVREAKGLSLMASAVSLIAIILAGHQGANITHGEGFLTAPLNPKNVGSEVSLENAIVFKDMVRPILEKKCMGCHNSQKAKGDLIMETQELLLKGGKNGKLWDLTKADLGLMMQRVHLPLDEKKHMPPIGKPQLTDEERTILFHWIKNGADFNKKLNELKETDTLRLLANSILKTSKTENYTFKAADENTIKKLNNNYRVITPLALNSPALSVEFFAASIFKQAHLKELENLKEPIVHLNLSKMPVQDEDLKTISSFKNLRKLNLSFTQITGATLGELKNLKELYELSLSGTSVKNTDLEVLKGMPHLSTLHIWNTAIAQKDLAALRTKLPNIFIESGFNGDTVVAKLSPPFLKDDEIQIFHQDTLIELRHYVKGAVIRYTLDGTDPDSLKSPIYEKGITLDKSTQLKAKAYLPDWISSDTLIQQYYRAGFKPDSVRLVHAPNPKYSGKGKTLFDDKKGDLANKSSKWLGFDSTYLEAYLYFNTPITLSKVTFSSAVDIGAYIMPPQLLEIWGGKNATHLTLLKTLNPTQPTKMASGILKGFDADFKPTQISVLKIVGKPVPKLPVWHPGKGKRAWFFIDEVFLN